MFYNFKFTKKGLKFIDKSLKQLNKVGFLSITESQLKELNQDIITNIDKIKEVL